jgi:GT2 family glycosyltransferase/2-polyprenyl-3-methyl-5-hydroxy-6-metoxy-1,4-benzoquinol methylase
MDLTLRSPEGKCAVLMMVEADGEVLVLPRRFQALDTQVLSEISTQVESKLDLLRSKEGKLPERFFLHGDEMSTGNVGAKERVVPGQIPYGTFIAHLQRYRFVESIASDFRTVLDLGCGTGYGLALLGAEESLGVDISEEATTYAQCTIQVGQREFMCADIRKLELGRQFDLVTAFEIVEHIPDHKPLLETVAAHLNDSGIFAVSVPNPHYHSARANPYHVRDLTGEHLACIMRDRFEEVSLFHQAHDIHGDIADRYTVQEGLSPDAEFYLAVGRRPKPVGPSCNVSIVIPAYNQVDYTLQCLRSIAEYANSRDGFYEVVVIDNASSDGTWERLKDVQGDLRVWRNDENLGFAKACNQGALLARGDVVVFLNNDTEVRPGWLEALTDELEENPSTGVVGARLLYPDGTIQHAGVAIGRDQIPYHIHRGLPADHPLVKDRRTYPVVTGACAGVRRKEFYTVGMFDEMFLNGHEDIDLCYRYRERGMSVVYRPECTLTHYESVSDGRMEYQSQNLTRTFEKWRPHLLQDDFAYSFPETARALVKEPLTFAIKIGPPDRSHTAWGDIYFAEGLAKSFSRLGHRCFIHYLDEWGRDDLDVDVVIHLKGLSEYRPKPYNLNLLWMLSHPDLHTAEELSRYDAVLVASTLHADHLKQKLSVPVIPLLQATDPEHFRPYPEESKEFDLVFVGNNTGVGRLGMRQIIADLLPTPYRLGVWGQGWEGQLPEGSWQGPFVPWEDLPRVYARAKIVLNDHHPDMKDKGFVNNRTFDVIACGARLISDGVRGIQSILPTSFIYRKRSELRRMVKKLLRREMDTDAETVALRSRVLELFSFDSRAREILDLVIGLTEARERRETASEGLSVERRTNGPLVSVLMSTFNRRRFLSTAIESVRSQRYRNWELVLVNDGGESVEDIAGRFEDPRIRLINLRERRGKGFAINRAFKSSQGCFIAYLDDDDIWYPDHLQSLILPLRTIPGIEMSYSDAYDVTLEEDREGKYREVKRELRYHHQKTIYDLVTENFIQGISVLHSRHLFEKAGGMDEELEVLIDWDLWRRFAALTYPYHVSRVTAEHFFRNASATTGKGQITSLATVDPFRYAQNRLRILSKSLPFLSVAVDSELLEKRRRSGIYHTYLDMGDRLVSVGHLDKAEQSYRAALQMNPNSFGSHRRLGVLALKRARLNQALEYFMTCVNGGSHEVSDYLYAALACLMMKRGEDVRTILDAWEARGMPCPESASRVLEEYRRKAALLSETDRTLAASG